MTDNLFLDQKTEEIDRIDEDNGITVLCIVKECTKKPFNPTSLKTLLDKGSYNSAIRGQVIEEKDGVVVSTKKGDLVYDEHVNSLEKLEEVGMYIGAGLYGL